MCWISKIKQMQLYVDAKTENVHIYQRTVCPKIRSNEMKQIVMKWDIKS
jgi:hypothetical protein